MGIHGFVGSNLVVYLKGKHTIYGLDICTTLGKKPHIWKINKGFMTGMAKFCGFLHLPLNPERLRKLTENYVSSNAKIKSALGIDCFPIEPRTGLKSTLQSFR